VTTGGTFTPVSSTLPTSGTGFVLGANTGTPGLPNTGMGGNAIPWVALGALTLVGTSLLLARKRVI